MSKNWKEQLKDVKRHLEDQVMGKVLDSRIRQRQDERQSNPKPVASQADPSAKSSISKASPTIQQQPSPLDSQSTQSRLPAMSAWQKERDSQRGGLFNIGIDFGTSATKVCARRSKGVVPNDPEPVYVAYLGGNTSYLCPSTVAIKNGRLYFGHEAERQASADVVPMRHLKACLACEVEHSGATGFAECKSARDTQHGQCTGVFNGSRPLSASHLVTLYLGWVMRESRAVLSEMPGDRSMVAFTYHVGMPLQHLDESPAFSAVYQAITYRAWQLSEGIVQGLDVDRAMGWLREVMREPVLSPENGPVQIAPEIVASLVPFIHGCVRSVGSLTPGLYGLVDIGAWTTDVAMFRYSERGIVSFPVTSVRRTGCNLVDERLRAGLLELIGAQPDPSVPLIETVRNQREASSFGRSTIDVARYRMTPPSSLLDSCLRITSGKAWRQFVDTVKCAHTNWRERYDEMAFGKFQVFILGGGSNIDILAKPPDYFKTRVTEVISLLPGVPANFVLLGLRPPAQSLPTTDYRRLAIAHGLAFPSGVWPEVNRPSQVEPTIPPPRRDYLTSEDLGYDEK